MMGVAKLWRCPYYEGVYIMKMSILCKCPYYEGFHDGDGTIIEVSILW